MSTVFQNQIDSLNNLENLEKNAEFFPIQGKFSAWCIMNVVTG